MSEVHASPGATTERRARRRWPYLVIILSLPVVALIGVLFYYDYVADRELQAAIDEADQLDPHWQLPDVEKDRAVIPPDKDSGARAIAAKQLLVSGWPAWDSPSAGSAPPEADEKRQALADSFQQLEHQRQLNPEQVAALRKEMKRASPALAEARKLIELTEGRYPITYSPDFVSTLIPHTQDARQVASLLAFDALLRAQDLDLDGALGSCRGVVNCGRSVGDEPLLVSQLVRMACRAVAVDRAQRVLAQGEPSEDALRQLQELLEKEEAVPLMLIGMRGERAGSDQLMALMQSGKLKSGNMGFLTGGPPGSAPAMGLSAVLQFPPFLKIQRAAMLRYTTKAVEIAKLPPEQQRERFKELDATAKDQPLLVKLLAPALGTVAEANLRTHAQLRSAIVATAAERYRRAKGQWPEQLEALKEAGYLTAIPTDPYDAQPLRLRRLQDGLVIYSVGPDGQDNGGKLDPHNPVAPGTDLGFRLWDVAQRRQPPDAAKPLGEPGAEAPPAGEGK
jgi:hypothetical protein